MSLELFLARKYLGARRGRGLSVISLIALAGVIVGVMSLVTVMAVMSGFEKDLREKILGHNAHILMSFYPEAISGDKKVSDYLKEVEEIEGVDSVMPVLYGEGFMLSPSGGSEGAFVKGVDTKRVRHVLDLEKYVSFKNWEAFENGGFILGESLAAGLSVLPGDKLTLLLNRAEYSPLGVVPKMRKIEVADLFHSGLSDTDHNSAYVDIQLASDLFGMAPYQLEVRALDVREIRGVFKKIRKQFEGRAETHDWLQANKGLLSALRLEKLVMGIILGLIILVAAFNICGSLIMIVRDKTKDIAILKSMGASDQSILRVFFTQGLFIGSAGTAIGVFLGVLLSLFLRDYVQFELDPEVYMIDTVPVDLRLEDIVLVIVGAMVITGLATLYPARMASRLNPIEGLKVD